MTDRRIEIGTDGVQFIETTDLAVPMITLRWEHDDDNVPDCVNAGRSWEYLVGIVSDGLFKIPDPGVCARCGCAPRLVTTERPWDKKVEKVDDQCRYSKDERCIPSYEVCYQSDWCSAGHGSVR
jgi:hypothetical protein